MDFGVIKITQTNNHNLIHKTVMTMIDDIIEDGTSYDCFVIDTNKDCWLEVKDDGEFVGLFQLSPFNRTVLDIHCYILKDKRNKSRLYIDSTLNWFKYVAPEMYKKLITQTPYKHIKKLLLKIGFESEGCYKKTFTKNKERLDLYLFGLERVDI